MFNCYPKTKQKRPIKVGNKIIGYLDDNRFIKYVIGSKHKLRSPPAWAIDAYSFDREIKPIASSIVVIDKESGIEYSCSMSVFDSLKGVLDRGFGRQYFLTLNNWEIKRCDPN